MAVINRVALIVRPKRRFVDWVNSLGSVKPKLSIEEARTNPGVYLVASAGIEELGPATPGVPELTDYYGTDLLEAELSNWAGEDEWPTDLSPRAFRQQFDVELAEAVEDLSEDTPLDPDEVDDSMDDSDEGVASEAESEAIEHALTHCAWCGKPLADSSRMLPLNFEAFHPDTLVAEGAVAPFPMPRAGRNLTALLEPKHHAHGPDFDFDEDEDLEDDLDEDVPEGGLEIEGVHVVFDREDDDAAAPHHTKPAPPVPDRPRTVLLLVCSEACRAKLVVAVEAEKEGR